MAHRECDAISPHSPRSQPSIPSWHIGEQENAIDQSSVQPAKDVGSGAVGPPHQSVMHDGGGNISPFLSARHTQEKCKNDPEIFWASPTKVVDSNVNVSIPCESRTSLDSAITPPSTRQLVSERSSPAYVAASTSLVRRNDACGSAQPLDKASTSDGGLIDVQGHTSLSGSIVDPCSNRGGGLSQDTDDAQLSNNSCHAPAGIRSTPLNLPFPEVTLSRHSHSTPSPSADGVGMSAGSHDTSLLSKGGTADRRCYVPKPASHAHSNSLVPDDSGGMRRALLSPTLQTTAQTNRVSTHAQKEPLHGAETSYMRASPLSLTTDTDSIPEDTSPMRVQHHDERMKCHLSRLPPPGRTSTFTPAKGTEHVPHGSGKHTLARGTSSAPMAPSLTSVEPRPLAPSSLTCNPLTQTPQISEGRFGEHEVEPSQLHDENAPSAASTPVPRYGDQPLASLRGCPDTRGKALRTPSIAVLVPLPPESAGPAPTPAPARKTSSLPMEQLESDTYEVNANSLTSERSFHYRERPSQRQQQRHPAPALEPRTSASVSPHHPFLSLVYLPTPKPERPRSMPARSSPPENGDPTLLEYVASLKPPDSSFSVCRGLLSVGVALCAVPLCAAILLFSLNYWAVTLQEKDYVEAVPHLRRGAGLAPDLALLLSILLSIVVMGGGSGVAIYFVLYRLAIRYQVRAFALCVQLADGLLPLEMHELAAEDSEGRYDSVMPIDAAAMAAHPAANGNALAKRVSPFVSRWHEEVSRLVNQLTCPIEVSHPEWRSFGFSERRRLSLLNEGANGSGDRLATGTMLTDGPFCNSNNSHVLPFGAQSSALMAENELWPPQGALPTSRYLMSEAIFSRRPHHPVELSKRQEAVTVVVCRFMAPAELLVQQGPLTQVQLKELQRLSNEFHQRLRTVPRTSYAAITEVCVCEVVFSFNTVSPLPSLVASPAAVSLAVLAHKALVDWSPTYFDTPVQWGISVHRFDAYMCPTRGMQGRLHLSFGTLEYDFARLLAELAALLNYGAVCHAGFLADASCESQCLPVDYVMDLRQQAFLVYQLHDGVVDREQRLQMNNAIAAMRDGQYKAAADSLGAWKRKRSGCGGMPMTASHLQYVAGFLECAARKGRPRALDVKEEVGNASSFTCAIEGVAEWAAENLLTSYFRPPPVWEEEEAPQVPSRDLLRAPSTVAPRRGGKCGLRARECGIDNVAVPSSRQPLRGAAGELATLFRSLMRRSYRARISYALFAQQQEGQVGSKDMEEAPYQPGEVSAAIKGNPRPRIPSQGSAWPPSPRTDLFSQGNLVDEGSASLLLRDTLTGFSSSSPATHSDFEMPTPNTTFGDVTSDDRKWAALALLTEADQSTVTVILSRPHLCSSSWSLAESGVPETANLTPLTSGVLRSPQLDVGRQRHPSILLPGVKKESEAAGTVAGSAPIQDPTTLRSARGRRESSGGKMEWPRGRNVSQFTTEVPTSDELSPRLLGHRGVSQLTDLSIARFPSEGSHDSLSVRSGSVRRRASASTAAASSILPLFADSPAPLFLQDRVESQSETEAASEADLNEELSMVSVAQRSRSRRSHRSTAQPSSVVCFCTRRIDNHSSNAVMVFQGFHPDGYLVVVKRADRDSVKEVAQLRNEVDLLRELHHRNIVNIVSTWKDDHAVYFAMEYACETLTTVLQKFKVLLPGVVRFYTRELLNALVYLHRDCGIIHRDLSPNNVIITNTTDRSRVKLIDFGRSIMAPHFCSGSNGISITVAGNSNVELAERRSSRNKVSVFDVPTSVVGTPLFMSPQACRGLAHPTNDIWSLGIIVHLCLTGTYPYPPESFTDPETFIANIGSGRLAPVISDTCEMTGEARNFIEQCLTLSQTERPSAAALLKHCFVER